MKEAAVPAPHLLVAAAEKALERAPDGGAFRAVRPEMIVKDTRRAGVGQDVDVPLVQQGRGEGPVLLRRPYTISTQIVRSALCVHDASVAVHRYRLIGHKGV